MRKRERRKTSVPSRRQGGRILFLPNTIIPRLSCEKNKSFPGALKIVRGMRKTGPADESADKPGRWTSTSFASGRRSGHFLASHAAEVLADLKLLAPGLVRVDDAQVHLSDILVALRVFKQ